jgi:glycosyltransferase involved in cell wall biosynthesis
MPSRSEGFGLVGLEAIGLGIPVLVSRESGLAELLLREVPEIAPDFVVPMAHDEETNYREWGVWLSSLLGDPERAIVRTAELRHALAERCTWERAAAGLIAAIRALSRSANR